MIDLSPWQKRAFVGLWLVGLAPAVGVLIGRTATDWYLKHVRSTTP